MRQAMTSRGRGTGLMNAYKKRNKGAVVEILKKPHQVSFPVQLEMHAVKASALVGATSEIGFYEFLKFHVV